MTRSFLFFLLLSCCFANWAAATEIGINQSRNRSTYMLELLKLTLSYSSNQYLIVEQPERLSKQAEKEAALAGKIDVFWSGTNRSLEQEFIPVPIDGYRGLMGMRFLIIRGNDQNQFSSVRTLSDLMRFKLGQGRNWSDIKILEAAGLTVEGSVKKTGLYHMLDGGRFDAFPRGATEAWTEAEAYKHLHLEVEKNLIIKYQLPTYFFVHKGNPQLAQDIKSGFKSALEDGSFDEYFFSNERVKKFLATANLEKRTEIEINNPFLSGLGENQREAYSLDVDQLIKGANRL